MEEKFSKNVGSLDLVLGCMFSGKSTELLRRVNIFKSLNKTICCISYTEDNRYGENVISTHNLYKIPCFTCTDLLKFYEEADKMIKSVDVIIIDEGQFYSGLYGFCKNLVDNHRKHIIVGGLDGDACQNKFGEILDLIPLADNYTKLKAYCKICNEKKNISVPASFTKRIQGNPNLQKDIGAGDKFIPVCRYHYTSSQ